VPQGIVRMHNALLGFYWLNQHCQLTALLYAANAIDGASQLSG